MTDIFISYSRLDREFVSKLRDALLTQNQKVWIDWESIPPSQVWWDEIRKGIAQANNFIIVLSPNSLASPVCHMEIEYARQLNKRLIPVLYQDFNEKDALAGISERLAQPDQEFLQLLWGQRQPHDLYLANIEAINQINYFVFKPDDDFKGRFDALIVIIQTDYAYKDQHTTLQLRANVWDQRQRNPSFLLLDDELGQALEWLASSVGKEPPPTDLHHAFIAASERRTRQLRNIRRASVIGTTVAIGAIIFAAVASSIGFSATTRADTANTRVAIDAVTVQAGNTQVAIIGATLTPVPPALTALANQYSSLDSLTNALGNNLDDPSLQISAVSTVLDASPSFDLAYIIRGNLYNISTNYQAALADFAQAIKLNPNNAAVYSNRGLIYEKQNEYDKALADFNQAIQLDPKNPGLYINRGAIYSLQGQNDKALADYNQALVLDPKNVRAYVNLGLVKSDLGQFDKAISDLNQAVRLAPQSATVYHSRGLVYRAQGQDDKALADFNQALALDPKSADAYNDRGAFFYYQGDYDKALADLNVALVLDPQNTNAYGNRGLVYYKHGDFDKALADFNQAIKIDPNLANAYFNRGNVYNAQQQYDKALADYNQALALDPKNVDAYINRGAIYANLEQYDKALTDYNQALALDPKNVDVYANRGNMYAAQGSNDKALADYNQALALDPTDAYTYANRGFTYQTLGQYDKALADFLMFKKLSSATDLDQQISQLQALLTATPALTAVPAPLR